MTLLKRWRRCLPTSAVLFLLIATSAGFARAGDLPRGVIIERVVCNADPTQSYSLYLPSSYAPQKKWPVIYAFDPEGRGDTPVKLYREAAEKYGYIVAGTYNTQNGMQSAPLQTAISTMIGDTRKRFSIDEQRVYTTGFSGGARIATRVASSCNGCIAGVIACGAGFPPDIKPTANLGFAFYGTVGVDDFNFPELRRLDEKLTNIKVPHRIAMFSGAHEWASPALLVEAIEWMEVQSMRAGRKVRDDAFIDVQWKKEFDRARGFENERKFYEAYQGYARMSADFMGLKDVIEIQATARQLKKDVTVVALAIKDERNQLEEQLDVARHIIDLGTLLLTDPSKRSSTTKELQSIIEGLRMKAKATDDSRERRVARRTIRQVLAETYEAAMFNYMPRKQYAEALVNFEVAGLVVPDSWSLPFEMARAFALKGEKKNALEALRRAVVKGLKDATLIENQKEFVSLRSETDFKAILNGLTRTSK